MTLTGEPMPDWLKDLVIRHDDGREVPIVGLYVLEGETIEAALLRGCPAGCSIVRRGAASDGEAAAEVVEVPTYQENVVSKGVRLLIDLPTGTKLFIRKTTAADELIALMAERYRWLRDECGVVEYKAIAGSIGPGMLPSGQRLDAAIDKARLAARGGFADE
jgi:hypothetical protein